ncbi:MAG: hypothetical protein OJF61_002690 [Rhodanobacteraceae bacterium]|nr:MAG: hypothetical protein OJF61_002690 [Rhodanobacteraceae bacterium]
MTAGGDPWNSTTIAVSRSPAHRTRGAFAESCRAVIPMHP